MVSGNLIAVFKHVTFISELNFRSQCKKQIQKVADCNDLPIDFDSFSITNLLPHFNTSAMIDLKPKWFIQDYQYIWCERIDLRILKSHRLWIRSMTNIVDYTSLKPRSILELSQLIFPFLDPYMVKMALETGTDIKIYSINVIQRLVTIPPRPNVYWAY